MGGSLGNSSWGGGDFYAKCTEILTEVEKNLGLNLYIFAAPVKAADYPEYHKVVKVPMDLGTMRGRLEGRQYNNPQEFCDVSLLLSLGCCLHHSFPFLNTTTCACACGVHVEGSRAG